MGRYEDGHRQRTSLQRALLDEIQSERRVDGRAAHVTLPSHKGLRSPWGPMMFSPCGSMRIAHISALTSWKSDCSGARATSAQMSYRPCLVSFITHLHALPPCSV